MGCIFSYCKNNSNQSFLLYDKHCFICEKTFTINDYNKHIFECNKNNSFKIFG